MLLVCTVLLTRSVPPMKVMLALATGAPAESVALPLMCPAVETNIFVGLGSAVELSVAVAVRALLNQPVFIAVTAEELRAGAGKLKFPFTSVRAEPAALATVTPAMGEQSIAFFTFPEIVPGAVEIPGLWYGTVN